MPSSIFGPREGNSLAQAMGQLKSMGSPQAAFDFLARSGATCTLPNGQRATIGELARMVGGKTPEQASRELGVDLTPFRNLM